MGLFLMKGFILLTFVGKCFIVIFMKKGELYGVTEVTSVHGVVSTMSIHPYHNYW